ncbi:formate dehydrogenase accessory protein [Thalassovita gelatinovora]|uniref:Sulfur carrier protein FdhD n=1 Tax=Thalassovita gelatinovora TaxID=53501 RepID=A0A0P1FJS9_THAGE|nr:formate dehydrogenase accessory sulfurtransferase FdhD [Thalassovita gelatinovora]QIZ81670.1 formate dehydrogenase accessory sulfurtransferase FdhD [Thalassovita gelatinovora]CUH68183.1 formate dehydrogenase accessory protein [Thalassovita gelatinovora]SEQ30780.1 FdhD protein [Thalassovita gelatinovora]
MQRRASHILPVHTSGPTDLRDLDRALPDEVPVALVYNGSTLAVMMASPGDLSDFALGFSLTEGIVRSAQELGEIEIIAHDKGIELRMWLAADRAEAVADRRRAIAGPVGCGLCGIDSLDQALRSLPSVGVGTLLRSRDIVAATEALRNAQPLHDETRAVHAAGFYRPGDGILCAREDVGRHNALDKLAGALSLQNHDPSYGALVVTSRLSSEMVQKAAMIGAPVLIAVSAPTALGVRLAEDAGITLVGRARNGRFDIFTHAQRIDTGGPQ